LGLFDFYIFMIKKYTTEIFSSDQELDPKRLHTEKKVISPTNYLVLYCQINVLIKIIKFLLPLVLSLYVCFHTKYCKDNKNFIILIKKFI